MARIRSVKPDLFSDPLMATVSIPARYLYIGLWTEADDEGRLYASPKRIAGALFPHDEEATPARVSRWLVELVALGRACPYTVDGTEYLFLPNFARHQKISHPSPSKLPTPPESLLNLSGVAPEKLVPDREQGTGNREQGSRKAGEAFERFWKPYPRKEEKIGAQTKFVRLVRDGVDPDAIIAGAFAYAEECRRDQRERRFIKMPTTWLNNGCWQDDYASSAADLKRAEQVAAANRLIEEGRRA